MTDELGKAVRPDRAINACLREANRWEMLARRSDEPESRLIAKRFADAWIEEAAEIERERV